MLDLHLPYRFDMWQVDSIKGLYDETRHVLHPVVRHKIEDVIHRYAQIIDDLPRGFVHGDMTRTNLLRRVACCQASSEIVTYTRAILATKYMCNVYEIDEKIETEEMVYWRNISIIYLMADSNAESPNEKAKEYCGYYTPSMWTERIS